jgi:hypothetical protein
MGCWRQGSSKSAPGFVRNMTFVTRNTSDVARTGVRLFNPFDSG